MDDEETTWTQEDEELLQEHWAQLMADQDDLDRWVQEMASQPMPPKPGSGHTRLSVMEALFRPEDDRYRRG